MPTGDGTNSPDRESFTTAWNDSPFSDYTPPATSPAPTIAAHNDTTAEVKKSTAASPFAVTGGPAGGWGAVLKQVADAGSTLIKNQQAAAISTAPNPPPTATRAFPWKPVLIAVGLLAAVILLRK